MTVNTAPKKGKQSLPNTAQGAPDSGRHEASSQSTGDPSSFYSRHVMTTEQILQWADAHHNLTGAWPKVSSPRVAPRQPLVWPTINTALQKGQYGLPPGSSLARLLAEHRGVRNPQALPKLTEDLVVQWMDAHHERTGSWPSRTSGPVQDAPGEKWSALEVALTHGARGLPGGSSIARLLAQHRDFRNAGSLPPLTVDQILEWADEHYQRTGRWPIIASGPVHNAPNETWGGVNHALKRGSRSLPSGYSLSSLLREKRNAYRGKYGRILTVGVILVWADEYYGEHRMWPNANSGVIPDTNGETWKRVDLYLRSGFRGLPGGTTLAQLLSRRRGHRRRSRRPSLSENMILEWADAHYARTGKWPNRDSGEIVDASGETWMAVQMALQHGKRGLPGETTLAMLLAKKRGVRTSARLPLLTRQDILVWADQYFERTGKWPTSDSGEVPDSDGETWAAINHALRRGTRGVMGGSSLADLLSEERGAVNRLRQSKLNERMIARWAKAHYAETKTWPSKDSGVVRAAPKESWSRVDNALRQGVRGLQGGSSLSRLLSEQCGAKPWVKKANITPQQIIAWAIQYKQRYGTLPRTTSGRVSEDNTETWAAISTALHTGCRGLPAGQSLREFFAEYRLDA